MKIELAYSLDAEEIVDPELAYDYFWAGRIKDKRSFECPAENCDAAITCANLDKLRQDMKVDPYYKTTGEHSPSCELVKDFEVKQKSIDIALGKSASRPKKDADLADIFELTRPLSHIEKTGSEPLDINLPPNEVKRSKKRSQSASKSRSASKHYSIRAFVSKYLKYKNAGIAAEKFIKIKGYDVSYEDMFVEISSQNITELSKHPRVYFGKVFINKRKEEDYAAIFGAHFSFNGQLIRPSSYISQDLILNCFTKKLYQKKFESLSDKKYPAVWAFVYGIPKAVESNGKNFININIFNMDHFDLREEI